MNTSRLIQKPLRAAILSFAIATSIFSPARSEAGVFFLMAPLIDSGSDNSALLVGGALLAGIGGIGLATKVIGPTAALIIISLGSESPGNLKTWNQGILSQKYPFLRGETVQALSHVLETTLSQTPASAMSEVQDSKTQKRFRKVFIKLDETQVRNILELDAELNEAETEQIVHDLTSGENV